MKFAVAALSTIALVSANKDYGICKQRVPKIGPYLKQLMFNAGVDTEVNLNSIGSITAHIAEAADASATGATIADGESGDIDFPHGNMKVLALSFVTVATTLKLFLAITSNDKTFSNNDSFKLDTDKFL